MDMWQPYKDIAETYFKMQLSLSINSISLGRSLGHLKELGKMSKRNLPRKGEDISKEVAPFS